LLQQTPLNEDFMLYLHITFEGSEWSDQYIET